MWTSMRDALAYFWMILIKRAGGGMTTEDSMTERRGYVRFRGGFSMEGDQSKGLSPVEG